MMYDGRREEPPYECPSCVELQQEIEALIEIIRELTQYDEVGQHDSPRCRFCHAEGNGYYYAPPVHRPGCILLRADIIALRTMHSTKKEV